MVRRGDCTQWRFAGRYHEGMRSNLASLVEDFRRHATETAVVRHRGNRRYVTKYGELASVEAGGELPSASTG